MNSDDEKVRLIFSKIIDLLNKSNVKLSEVMCVLIHLNVHIMLNTIPKEAIQDKDRVLSYINKLMQTIHEGVIETTKVVLNEKT